MSAWWPWSTSARPGSSASPPSASPPTSSWRISRDPEPPGVRAATRHVTSFGVIPRADAVSAMGTDSFDLVVVGGGITGAGVARDAASRGYSVALVERDDYASGTSSRSSKLVHGGLRYLQNFDLGLVREALLERQLNVNLAPYLVRPLRLVVPAFDGARLDRVVGLGLNAYHVMSVDRIRRRRRRPEDDWSPARHRVIPGHEVSELIPALAERSPTSGY